MLVTYEPYQKGRSSLYEEKMGIHQKRLWEEVLGEGFYRVSVKGNSLASARVTCRRER